MGGMHNKTKDRFEKVKHEQNVAVVQQTKLEVFFGVLFPNEAPKVSNCWDESNFWNLGPPEKTGGNRE